MKPIIFIGGGGHALSVLGAMPSVEQVIGYADMQVNDTMRIPYLGTDEQVMAKYSPEKVDVFAAVVYTKDVNMQLRKRIMEKYHAYHFATCVAPSAIVKKETVLGEGVSLLERAVVKAKEIGANSIVNTGALIEHGCQIGSNTLIATGAIVCGDVNIGNDCIIGAGAIIRDGITICDGAIIGIGAVVTKDINLSGVYVGNPAKQIQ